MAQLIFHDTSTDRDITYVFAASLFTFTGRPSGGGTGEALFTFKPASTSPSVTALNEVAGKAIIDIADGSAQHLYGTTGTKLGTQALLDYVGGGSAKVALLNTINGHDVLQVTDGLTFRFYGTDGTRAGTTLDISYTAKHAGATAKLLDTLNTHDVVEITDGTVFSFIGLDGTKAGSATLLSYDTKGKGSLTELNQVNGHDLLLLNTGSGTFDLYSTDGSHAGTVRLEQYLHATSFALKAAASGHDLLQVVDKAGTHWVDTQGTTATTHTLAAAPTDLTHWW
jgi:hypothetical protein